jgi:hypothetical protein
MIIGRLARYSVALPKGNEKQNKTGKGRKKVERDLMFLSVVCL